MLPCTLILPKGRSGFRSADALGIFTQFIGLHSASPQGQADVDPQGCQEPAPSRRRREYGGLRKGRACFCHFKRQRSCHFEDPHSTRLECADTLWFSQRPWESRPSALPSFAERLEFGLLLSLKQAIDACLRNLFCCTSYTGNLLTAPPFVHNLRLILLFCNFLTGFPGITP